MGILATLSTFISVTYNTLQRKAMLKESREDGRCLQPVYVASTVARFSWQLPKDSSNLQNLPEYTQTHPKYLVNIAFSTLSLQICSL